MISKCTPAHLNLLCLPLNLHPEVQQVLTNGKVHHQVFLQSAVTGSKADVRTTEIADLGMKVNPVQNLSSP